MVGKANGRSMIAFTTDLPAKESRTRTHAMIVPNTAVVSTASVDMITVSFSAETAWGDETTSQKPDQPLPVDRQMTAAIGSTTMISRNVVTKPTCRERAIEALSLVRGRRREPRRLGDRASCQWAHRATTRSPA